MTDIFIKKIIRIYLYLYVCYTVFFFTFHKVSLSKRNYHESYTVISNILQLNRKIILYKNSTTYNIQII